VAIFALREDAVWDWLSEGDDWWFYYSETKPFDTPPARQTVVIGYDAPSDDDFYNNTNGHRWFGSPDHITFTSNLTTDIVGVMIAFKGTDTNYIWDSAYISSTGELTQQGTPQLNNSDDASFERHYGEDTFFLGVWAGSGAGTWSIVDLDVGGVNTEVASVAADSVDLFVTTKVEEYGGFVWPMYAEYTVLTNYQASIFSIVDAPRGRLFLKALLQPGNTFSMDAYIGAAFHTTHPRTGPHFGMHPSDVIVTSATLGSLPPGTDLNTVIADLDDLLTELEE